MSKARRFGISEEESSPVTDHELDWSYTARCTKEWSDDELLSYLCSNAFTIPPRDYNPSAPFVYVRSEDGVTTTLPHGYRLPLMFIAKYQWETTTRTLSLHNRQRWDAVRDEIFHLSRLCHVLLSKARAKAESNVMEKGWRCVMFDRVLTRFYKGWPVSSPPKLESFLSHFSLKEYERDILKYDWKRWALKGFFRSTSSPTIHLTEEDVNDGITAVNFKIRLSKINNVWTLSTRTKNNSKCRPIKFMQATDSSSSELTDLDSSDDEHTHDMNLSLCPPFVVETPTKRGREISEEDNNRSGKRTKMEEIIRSLSSQPCSPLAMPDPLGSEDVFEENEDHDPLPKFRAPRQTLFVHGWKPLSAMDDVARQRQREGDEEEEEMGVILPACSFNSSTSVPTSSRPTSTSIPPDYPMNDPSSSTLNRATSSAVAIPPPFTPSLQEKTPTISLSTPTSTSLSSKSKGKQPESVSTHSTTTLIPTAATTSSRSLRNSAYVSIPSSSKRMKPRTRPPAPVLPPTALEFTRSPFSSPVTEKEATTKSIDASVILYPNSQIKYEISSVTDTPRARRQFHQDRQKMLLSPSPSTRNRAGAGDDTNQDGDKDVKAKEKEKGKGKKKVKVKVTTVKGKKSVVDDSESQSFGIQDLASWFIPASNNTTTNDERDQMMTITLPTAAAATSDTPCGPPYNQAPNLDLMHTRAVDLEPLVIMSSDPKRVLMAQSSGAAAASSSSSSPLSSLSPSHPPSSPGPSISMIDSVAVALGADGASEAQQLKDRFRELRARFLGLKDVLGGIIGRLEGLEGVREMDGVEGGDLVVGRAGGGGGILSGYPDFVPQASRMEEKRKEQEKESRDVEMASVSRSDAVPGYVDGAVGVDALLVFRDVSVQIDQPPHAPDPTVVSTTAAAQTIDVSSATLQDELSNTQNIKPSTPLELKNDDISHQFMNATSLSTLVDNLVSVKMLSMMQTLVKGSSVDGSETKPVEISTTTTTEAESDILHQPSPSLLSSISASHSMDAYDTIVANLLDELKTIKEEARCREQSEKEDLLAMRQLHSAEVDALRRRLSYLESRNPMGLGRWEGGGGGGGGGSRPWRGVDSLDLDRHHHHHRHPFVVDSNQHHSDHRTLFRQQKQQQQQQCGDRSLTHYHPQNDLLSSSSSTVHPGGGEFGTTNNNTPQASYTPLSLKNTFLSREAAPPAAADSTTMNAMSSLPTPTPPTPSERHHSFGFSKNGGHHHHHHGMDLLDEDIVNPLPLPLPVKSQRKHHMMALARAHFS